MKTSIKLTLKADIDVESDELINYVICISEILQSISFKEPIQDTIQCLSSEVMEAGEPGVTTGAIGDTAAAAPGLG